MTVERLEIGELWLGSPLAGVASRWRINGHAQLKGLDGVNSLSLNASRNDDRTGRVLLDASYDGRRGVLNARGEFEEGEGGIVATLLGRPDLPSIAGGFRAQLTDLVGDAHLSVEGGDVLGITGTVRIRSNDAGRQVALALQVTGGQIPDPVWKAALAQPASVQADILIEPAGAIAVRALRLKAAPLEATASGRFVPTDKRLQLRLSAIGGDAAVLAAIVPGATWRDVRFDMEAAGTMTAIDGTLSLRAADVALAEASTRELALTATVREANPAAGVWPRGELRGTLGEVVWHAARRELAARDVRVAVAGGQESSGAIGLTSFDLASSQFSVAGTGTLTTDGGVLANVMIEVPDMSAFNPIMTSPVAGSAQVKLRLTGTRAEPVLAVDATLRDGIVQNVPHVLLAPELRLSASGSIDRQQRWRLEWATIASDAISATARGAGAGGNGTLDAIIMLPRLGAVDRRLSGTLRSDIHVQSSDERSTVSLRAAIAQAKVDGTNLERLTLDADLVLGADQVDATLQLDGSSAGQQLRASGRISAVGGERLLISEFNGALGGTNLTIRDLAVDRTTARGSARLLVEDLKQLSMLTGQPLAGRLEVDIVSDNVASAGKLKLGIRGTGLALADSGADTLTADATIGDPLGDATFEASIMAHRLRGVAGLGTLSVRASGDWNAIAASAEASGPGVILNGALTVRRDGREAIADIVSLRGTYAGRPFGLAGATRLRQSGERITVEGLRLNVAGGSIRVAGTIDAANSELSVDVVALKLAELAALVGGEAPLDGTVQAQLQVRGALANPEIAGTYTVRDARLRSMTVASIPAALLTGKVAMRERVLSADARLAAGTSRLAIGITGQLPSRGALPDGQLTVVGPIDLVIFASLIGPDIQLLAGRALVDVALAVRRGRPTGTGTMRLEDVRLSVPREGMILSKGNGTIRMAGERIVVERVDFPAVGKGDVVVGGEVQLDPNLPLAIDLWLKTRNARLMTRRDLIVDLTSSLRLHGSLADGLTAEGQIQIDRAEINAAVGTGAKSVASVPVREVGAGAPKKDRTGSPARPLALDLKVSAPRGVFVRGQGLDAEVGGELAVKGTSANPSVVGGLKMRRGSYSLLGRNLTFSRGAVTLANADRIAPILDLEPTTRGGNVTVVVKVTGPASEPKIELRSSPMLPQDEIIAQLLFGKGTARLGPTELGQLMAAVGELSGIGPSGSSPGFIRRALGLNGLGGGRGAVQIEILPRVKLDADIGINSTGRAGLAWEYDY
ncbi:hypothetical protein FHP25_08540 [Vineibacter terrae]|uniref:Translocation and assembly module TamB C-terminal domain-containing protein n=1 Tax=Vineibacter terrae TaxID=2586908 RepID=A0A5C8PS55_9HYPH|nr:translocation/assembly module TamB domain-containing protein [Vineibacter terrae]TXL78232.1 hypothetical protein FHP25_08540 [Vineibacter terrae]